MQAGMAAKKTPSLRTRDYSASRDIRPCVSPCIVTVCLFACAPCRCYNLHWLCDTSVNRNKRKRK